MPIRFRDRLSYKQARNTVVIAFFLGLFISLFQVVMDYQSQDRQIDQTIETYIAITRAPAARIAYNIDKELAYELVQGLSESPAIVHAEIVDPDGESLAAVSTPPMNDNARSFTDVIFGANRTYIRELKVPYDEDEKLGWLKIVADTSPIGRQFVDRAVVTLATGLLRSFILSLILLTMLYLMLTKPLLNLTEQMVEHPEDNTNIKIPEPKGHERDEIGLLTRTINHYLSNINHHLHHRRLAEEQLRQHLAELETIIARRTSEIRKSNDVLANTNRELEVARRQAMNTASHRAQQLSSLSHEIRTPLNGLLGMLSIALDDELPEIQRKRLSIARDSGVHLIKLLNDILDLSKLESGKMTMEAIPFDLRATIEDVVMLIGQTTYSRGVPIYSDIDPTLPELVLGDPTRMHQVISNLLGNAAKFTDQGEIRLWLDSRQDSDSELEVVLNISDTGIGIPASSLEEIFKPFGQASTDTSRKFGGSGMGLPLTQSIVNGMNGGLSVISEPGEGSTFSVKLPLKLCKSGAPEPHNPAFNGNQILLHGSEALLTTCSHLLTHWDCQHRIVEPGPEDQSIPDWGDLLLTDDVELALNTARSTPSLKVVVANSIKPSDERENLNWLPLPMTRDNFLETLQKALGLEPASSPDKQKATSNAGSSSYQLLVVEDNPINRMVAEGMLEQLGYRVELAQHGENCLKACESKDYDLILMDCNMPVMDGFTATRELRKQKNTQDIPIIALTANALNEHRQKCLEAGMNDHIAKPFNKQELQSTLSRWLPVQESA